MLKMKEEIRQKCLELVEKCMNAEQESIRLHNLYIETGDTQYWAASREQQECKENWTKKINGFTTNLDNYFDDGEQ